MDLSYFLKRMNCLNDNKLNIFNNKPQHTTSCIKHWGLIG